MRAERKQMVYLLTKFQRLKCAEMASDVRAMCERTRVTASKCKCEPGRDAMPRHAMQSKARQFRFRRHNDKNVWLPSRGDNRLARDRIEKLRWRAALWLDCERVRARLLSRRSVFTCKCTQIAKCLMIGDRRFPLKCLIHHNTEDYIAARTWRARRTSVTSSHAASERVLHSTLGSRAHSSRV